MVESINLMNFYCDDVMNILVRMSQANFRWKLGENSAILILDLEIFKTVFMVLSKQLQRLFCIF